MQVGRTMAACPFLPIIRLLRIVNSPLYGFPKQIDTITRAVNLIGMQAVSDFVTATTIGPTFTCMTSDLIDLSAYWRKSVLCALMAWKIAKSCGIEDAERFFIEGLLRDIGHLVLDKTVSPRAQSALVEAGHFGAQLAEVEQASIGCDFTEVGAELIHSWGMPTQIEQAIRHQLRPNEAREFTHHASIVHSAGVVVDYEDSAQAPAKQDPSYDASALSVTRFKVEECPALLKEAHDQLQDTLGRDETQRLVGIGIAVPSPVDPSAPDHLSELVLPAWKGSSGFDALSQRFGVPILVDNDANLGALAEKWWGAGRDIDDFAYIKLATGMGSAHIIGGDIYRGANGIAGEIGHLAIDPHGAPCICGLRGCLATLIGAPALVARARDLLARDPDSLLVRGEGHDLRDRGRGAGGRPDPFAQPHWCN